MASTAILDISEEQETRCVDASDACADTGIHELVDAAQDLVRLLNRPGNDRLSTVELVSRRSFQAVLKADYQARKGERRRPVVLRVFRTPDISNSVPNRLLKEYLRALHSLGGSVLPRQVGDHYRAGENTVVRTEFIPGRDLTAYIRERPTPTWREFMEVLARILLHLEQMHRSYGPHFDLTPSNIWIEAGSRRVRFLDVGALVELPGQAHTKRYLVTTTEYTAPAIKARLKPGPRTDFFAFGACLLHAISLIVGETFQDVQTAQLRLPPVLSCLGDGPLQQVFEIALECVRGPDSRLTSVERLQAAISKVPPNDLPIIVRNVPFPSKSRARTGHPTSGDRSIGESWGFRHMLNERLVSGTGIGVGVLLIAAGALRGSPYLLCAGGIVLGGGVLCEVMRRVAGRVFFGDSRASLVAELRHTLGLGTK